MKWLLSQFSLERFKAQRAYRRFVAQGKGVRIWEDLKGGVILDGETFVEYLGPLLKERRGVLEIPRREKLVDRPTLEELFSGVKGRATRDARIYKAIVKYGYRLVEVGGYLGLHYFTVIRIVGRQKAADIKSKNLTHHRAFAILVLALAGLGKVRRRWGAPEVGLPYTCGES